MDMFSLRSGLPISLPVLGGTAFDFSSRIRRVAPPPFLALYVDAANHRSFQVEEPGGGRKGP